MIRINVNDVSIKGSYRTVYEEFCSIFELFINNVLLPKYKDKEKVRNIIIKRLDSILEEKNGSK